MTGFALMFDSTAPVLEALQALRSEINALTGDLAGVKPGSPDHTRLTGRRSAAQDAYDAIREQTYGTTRTAA